jgi:hypothetical protein
MMECLIAISLYIAGLGIFVRGLNRSSDLADSLVSEVRTEAAFQYCAAQLAAAANLADAQRELSRLDPQRPWLDVRRAVEAELGISASRPQCQPFHGLQIVLRHETNPSLPQGIPNWVARWQAL